MKTKLKLSDDDYGSRLDAVLSGHLSGNSRSHWSRQIGSENVLVNGEKVRSSYKIKAGDQVVIQVDLKPIEPIDIEIIYQDDNVVVINKPVGVLSHAKGEIAEEYTIADFMKQYFSGTETNRSGIVHRLDRTTSGVMICARTERASKFLQKQFASRNVKKQYIALVEGVVKDNQAILDLPIERNPKQPSTFRVGPNGKPAQTEFEVIKRGNDKTLVELSPKTGRTHQLRVHLAFMGHPIIGDELYGGHSHDRVMLHASRLELTLPDSQRKVFESDIPGGFEI